MVVPENIQFSRMNTAIGISLAITMLDRIFRGYYIALLILFVEDVVVLLTWF